MNTLVANLKSELKRVVKSELEVSLSYKKVVSRILDNLDNLKEIFKFEYPATIAKKLRETESILKFALVRNKKRRI